MTQTHNANRTRNASQIVTGDDLYRLGVARNAYPTDVSLRTIVCRGGHPGDGAPPSRLTVPGKAVVASYQDGIQTAHAAVSDRWEPCTPEEWRETLIAAVDAFSLGGPEHDPKHNFRAEHGGPKIVASFALPSQEGFKSKLHIVDSFDRSCSFMVGASDVRVYCSNQFRAMFGDGAKIRHTKSLHDRIAQIQDVIAKYIESGRALVELYGEARRRTIDQKEAIAILCALFPAPKEDGRARSRALNLRSEALEAAQRRENQEGSSVATLWNAATWMVDRHADGRPRKSRSDATESMLLGSRAKRVEEIRTKIEVVMADGTAALMDATEAANHGIDDGQIGRALLSDLLN